MGVELEYKYLIIGIDAVMALTLIIFLAIIYPSKFDKKKFANNNLEIIELYEDSGLFVVDKDGNYNAKCTFNNIMTLQDIYSLDVSYGGVIYNDLSITESLYDFYTTKFYDIGDGLSISYKNNDERR